MASKPMTDIQEARRVTNWAIARLLSQAITNPWFGTELWRPMGSEERGTDAIVPSQSAEVWAKARLRHHQALRGLID
jgi:hypothetical protein